MYHSVKSIVIGLALATGLTACGGGSSSGTISVIVDSDSDWRSNRGRDDRWGRDTDRARERVGRGSGGASGCNMVVDSSGRIRSTCPGGRLVAQFAPQADSAIDRADRSSRTALKYSIPLESAEALQSILSQARSNEADVFSLMGFSKQEALGAVVGGFVADSSVEKVATALGMSRSIAEDLIDQILAESKAQLADVESPAWQACQQTGKWRTNANGGVCKSTSWTGCSPESGATFCSAIH
ncbi:MAG: hypothetical protein J0L82_16515 [Deltaproteobacteria bacterium]|jgi:hypothetical protein|nr:hypothetical protein [Deltaproteobacteria bacterium]